MRTFNIYLDKMLYVGTAITSLAFFIIVIIAVLTRYVFKMPILASIELSRLFFVWSCFLAAAITFRRQAHVSITFLFEKFPKVIQKILTPLLHIFIIVFMGTVFYQSIIVTQLLWNSKLPMLQITQSWFYIPVPIISAIMISFSLEFLIDDLAHSKTGEV